MVSRDNLPLDDCGIVSTSRYQQGVFEVKLNFSYVGCVTMTDNRFWLLIDWWISKDMHFIVVISRGDQLHIVNNGSVWNVNVINVSTILSGLPDTLCLEAIDYVVCSPLCIFVSASTSCLLLSIWNGIIEQYVWSVYRAYQLTIKTPVHLSDKRSCLSEFFSNLSELVFHIKEPDLAFVGCDC